MRASSEGGSPRLRWTSREIAREIDWISLVAGECVERGCDLSVEAFEAYRRRLRGLGRAVKAA